MENWQTTAFYLACGAAGAAAGWLLMAWTYHAL